MTVQYNEVQELLRSRADLHARLNLMPYDGTPEIKERGGGKYLYVRKRVAGKQTSTYVGVYTEELYNLLLRNARESREIRKSLRSIEKQLAAVGYSEDELSADVITNIEFARANMKMNIYDQAYELAKAIKTSEEMQRLDAAAEKLKENDEAKKMVKEYLTEQMKADYARMMGQKEDGEKYRKLQEMAVLVSNNSTAQEYLQAFLRWQQVAGDVQKIVGEAMMQGTDVLELEKQ